MAVATQALKQQVFQLFDRGVVIDSIPDRVPVSRATVVRFRREWRQLKEAQQSAA
jgi:transposase-like protein